MIVPTTPIANPTEVNKITTTATSQAGTLSGGQGGGMARRDTFTYMGVTFMLALSAIVKRSVPCRQLRSHPPPEEEGGEPGAPPPQHILYNSEL